MPVNDTVSKWVTLPLSKRLTRFAREDDGLVTILALFMIMMMIAVGGIQLDFMRHEMERSRLQAVSDRAVLAAADLDQMRDPKTVVEDYFAKSGMTEFLSNVVVDDGLNFRTVTVDASKDMDTQFIGRFGFPTLEVPAHSQAEERVAKVEISLVLDISGSMATNNRLGEVQNAADIFLDTVLKDENEEIADTFLKNFPDFALAPAEAATSEVRELVGSDGFLRCYPHIHDTDGFFAAVLVEGDTVTVQRGDVSNLDAARTIDAAGQVAKFNKRFSYLKVNS